MTTDDDDKDPIEEAVFACLDAAVHFGVWQISHPETWSAENIDATWLAGLDLSQRLAMAEDVFEGDFDYRCIEDGIDHLAVESIKNKVVTKIMDLVNENGIDDADALSWDPPGFFERIRDDEGYELLLVFDEDGDEDGVWRRCVFDLGDQDRVLYLDVTSTESVDGIMIMRAAVESDHEQERGDGEADGS